MEDINMKVGQNSNYVNSQMMYSSQAKKQEEVQQSTFASQIKDKTDMSLDEYKAYFNEKMNSLYTHPSQRNRNDIIDITDAAYKRMQTDPEYEQKILDALAKNKAVDFGNNIPQISYMHIDDTWEGCYGYTQGMKENDSYVKGNSSKHENNVKKKKEDRNKELLEEYIEKRIQARKDMQEFRTKEYFKHKGQNAELSRKALAAKAYEQQILQKDKYGAFKF